MRSDHYFNRICDYFTAHKRGLHALVAHSNAIRNGNRGELPWSASSIFDTALGALGKPSKMDVTGGGLITCRRYSYQRPVQVSICQSHRLVHCPMRSPLWPIEHLSTLELHYNYRYRCIF